jgi:O-antigen/teichoic acid export membrane protein
MLKKLASDTALYGLSSIVGRLLNWLLVIVHTRVFKLPRLLADNNELYVYVIVLNVLFTFGMETAFFRYASKQEHRKEYFNLILTYIILLSTTLSGLFILLRTPIVEALGYPNKERLITWFAIILATDAIAAIAFVKLRAENRAKKFVSIKLVNIFINIGLNAFYLMFCKSIHEGHFLPELKGFADYFYNPKVGPDYIVWANFVASLVTILMLWREFIGFRIKIDWAKFKPVFIYAYPLMIMGLAGALNLTADRLLLRHLLPEGFYRGLTTEDAFSIYSNIYKLSIFMTLVVQAYRYAADPFFFSRVEDKNSPLTIALATKWFTIACIVIWVGVSLNLDWIKLLLGGNYRKDVNLIVPILLLANLFIGVYGNIGVWFRLSDNTKFGSRFTLIGMSITVILNIILIPQLGYLGCAITFAISSFVMAALCYYYGQKHYPIPYEMKTILIYLIGAGIIIFINSRINISNIWISIALRMTVCLVFFAMIAVNERKTLGLQRWLKF